ncbi:hypothetical protein SPRG_02392 [Saprolegnia parasitica CBS 223.65]|uniref:SAM domain-containing protein n=1 Tax=Saprolegnia parasitica (strain CBS 223.65) TaxID=695850 RepID=A0A067D110_SAPPC|nr:hypothetical protein SPRG_02392 [Saprolegnia parasitica CBS 223.65]KDO32692.1 hypothetical protein SPRG_02392 [Saprolegnia parasitica CBS 223.65]|eukprot:XP_012196358.1 hypothetical protein SPRG_02392 [Saprolegnia parasitica CBS 223.65]
MKARAGFGAAKPLPGQQGYKVKESQRLEADAQRMEEDLLRVRERMALEAQQREKGKAKMKDGNRWRSAREDRGSVRKYAQDVRDRPVGEKRKTKSQAPSPGPRLDAWSVAHVLEWLSRVGLGHHTSTFEFNEVSGSVLMEITPSDLDYLQITDATERKAIFHQIEQLRRTSGPPPVVKVPLPTNVEDDKLHDAKILPLATAKKTKHWSQLAPIADNPVMGAPGAPVNLADGDFNEAESHESFLKALLEWRATDVQPEHDDNGFWSNPLGHDAGGGALLSGQFDEEQSHAAFLDALAAWRRKPTNSINSAQTPKETTQSGTAGSPIEPKRSCWQCYALFKTSQMILDAASRKEFCSNECRGRFCVEYARFYAPTSLSGSDSPSN